MLPDSKQQIEVERVVVTGKPFLKILRIAKEKNADLIVMATGKRMSSWALHLGASHQPGALSGAGCSSCRP